MTKQTSHGRYGPVDVEVAKASGMALGQPCCDATAHADADSDYFRNLRRFERHDDMAAEPTRGKGD